MKKIGVACVLIAFTIGAQMAMAADKKPQSPVQSGASLTVQGNMKESNSAQSADSGSIPPVDMAVSSSSSSAASSGPQPLDDQKIKTKSNIKND